jgi:hypothetical protein
VLALRALGLWEDFGGVKELFGELELGVCIVCAGHMLQGGASEQISFKRDTSLSEYFQFSTSWLYD